MAGWTTDEYAQLIQLQQLTAKQLRIILQLKVYPGFAAVEAQTRPFLAGVDRLGR